MEHPHHYPAAHWMQRAVTLAVENVKTGGGPFAALVVRDDVCIAEGVNRVTVSNDPTAHAEVMAIREACEALDTFQLSGCELYTSCEPCPMCLGAIYWARLDRVYYSASRTDAAAAGFDDEHIYRELERPPDRRHIPMERVLKEEGGQAFEAWRRYEARVEY